MKQLFITFEGPHVTEDGVPLEGFLAALRGIQDAMRLMVEYLGNRPSQRGQPPRWVREQSALRLVSTKPGSFVAELARVPQQNGRFLENDYGSRALAALEHWDGTEDSILPRQVTNRIYDIPSALPEDIRLWLGNDVDRRRIELKRVNGTARLGASTSSGLATEAVLLYGWLNAVNWNRCTAELHRIGERYVPLRFDSALHDDMLRYATQLVEVRGQGRINNKDEWQYVRVEQLNGSSKVSESFDLDAFLNNPNPKTFDSEKVITASQPFDVDEFIRVIREGRDVDMEEAQE